MAQTILFQCPVCDIQLAAAPEQAGAKLNCPKCQQRLQIPQPPINRTMLGTLPAETEVRRSSAPVASRASSPSSPHLALSADDGWFYARDKRQIGPVSFQRLQQLAAAGQLAPADMVHRNGMAKWIAAGSLPGLFATAASAGTSNGGASVAPSPARVKGTGHQEKWLVGSVLGVFGILGVAGVAGVLAVCLMACLLFSLVMMSNDSPTTPAPPDAKAFTDAQFDRMKNGFASINVGQMLIQRTHPTGSYITSNPPQMLLSTNRREILGKVTVKWSGAITELQYQTDFTFEITKDNVRLTVDRDLAVIQIDPNQLRLAEGELMNIVRPLY